MPARKTNRKPAPATDILSFNSNDIPEEFSEREALFSIDGVEYTVPVKFPASAALEYMHLANTVSVASAFDYAMTEGLGEDGYRALRQYKGLTQDNLNEVFGIILAKINGLDPKAKDQR